MPTTQNTNSQNQYNPGSMNAYNAFSPQMMSSFMQMAANPLGSSYFQNQLAQQKQQSMQVGQRNQSNLLQNMRTGGGILSNSGGFMNAALNRNNIGNSTMQSNAFNSSMNQALNNRNSSLMAMEAYQPLQTGQNTQQFQSGIGTWLAPVAGAAMNALMPGIGGLLSGQGFSSGYGGGGGTSSRSMGMPPMQTGSMNPASNPFGQSGQYPMNNLPY